MTVLWTLAKGYAEMQRLVWYVIYFGLLLSSPDVLVRINSDLQKENKRWI